MAIVDISGLTGNISCASFFQKNYAGMGRQRRWIKDVIQIEQGL